MFGSRFIQFSFGENVERNNLFEKRVSMGSRQEAKDNRRRQRNNITPGTGDKAGDVEGGRDKRTRNEQSAITICHASKRCDGRAVIKYKRYARRLRKSVAVIMRFARHACERNGQRKRPLSDSCGPIETYYQILTLRRHIFFLCLVSSREMEFLRQPR